MGFSKGAYAAAIAMAMEPRISAAWLDSGPFHGLRGSDLMAKVKVYRILKVQELYCYGWCLPHILVEKLC